ncbi:MAG: FAD-dependent oxidoreductase [Saprospiraceae bacterium]
MEQEKIYDVIILGAGTGATAAAIQSARSGAKTLWINPLNWAGGMWTSAGVSATDGNHRLPAGLWSEFRDSLRQHYGGVDSLFTGWVSNTMFEPRVGAMYLGNMIKKEANLLVHYQTNWDKVEQADNWKIEFQKEQKTQFAFAKILIDGTDLGDVAAQVGATYDIGMDDASKTGEAMAPGANNIIQDLTYSAILKEYPTEKVIPKPDNYDPAQFYCACKNPKCDDPAIDLDCKKMLDYGKLPNDKYMINWPKKGNDYYANIIEASAAERAAAFAKAKEKTLHFIYFIQTELGFPTYGIAEDEFPTDDNLPLYPYHREGRRIHGEVQMNVNHILDPYATPLYRTGIAVGDYPIDHHHYEYSDAPEIEFPSVPSFNVPLGSLIPKNVDNLVVADKPISVTNIVNGSSRLQPVILQIGQVAGLVAAEAAKADVSPKDLNIRNLQNKIVEFDGYLMPFIDVEPSDPHFESIQRIGATGILRGKGIPYQWANQTWFYPDTFLLTKDVLTDLKAFDSKFDFEVKTEPLTVKNAVQIIQQFQRNNDAATTDEKTFIEQIKQRWTTDFNLENFDLERLITKRELAVVLDKTIDPFSMKSVNLQGDFLK